MAGPEIRRCCEWKVGNEVLTKSKALRNVATIRDDRISQNWVPPILWGNSGSSAASWSVGVVSAPGPSIGSSSFSSASVVTSVTALSRVGLVSEAMFKGMDGRTCIEKGRIRRVYGRRVLKISELGAPDELSLWWLQYIHTYDFGQLCAPTWHVTRTGVGGEEQDRLVAGVPGDLDHVLLSAVLGLGLDGRTRRIYNF